MMEKWEGQRVYRRPKGQKVVLGQKEKRRLLQLGFCLIIFLGVLFIKGGEQSEQFREDLEIAIQANADFGQALTRLGQARRSGRPLGETVRAFWTQVFLPNEQKTHVPGQNGPLYLQVKSKLTDGKERKNLFVLSSGVRTAESTEPPEKTPTPKISAEETVQPQESETPEPEETRDPEWRSTGYDGPDLPENVSMDWYSLHLEDTVAPVMGSMTSPFGWREDPFDGEDQVFHHGLDLGVPIGTDVLAFASGTVEYIGESDIYGLYLQIDHGNGVKSFYAHCSKLCVGQGKTVSVGDKIAESGDTGNATGPHLHLELKRDGIYLDPRLYVNVLA